MFEANIHQVKEKGLFLPDLLMTTFTDGQFIIWNRRVQTSRKGIGRLWVNEKTPPWCLSVSAFLRIASCQSTDDQTSPNICFRSIGEAAANCAGGIVS